MTTIQEIISFLDNKYPLHLRATWDVTEGLVEGDVNKKVKKVIVSLELNEQVLQMLWVHHLTNMIEQSLEQYESINLTE